MGEDDDIKVCFRKVANAAQKAFADRALARDENQSLRMQNNEKKAREAAKSAVVGNAKVISYPDIEEARKKRDLKIAGKAGGRGRKLKRKLEDSQPPAKKQPRTDEQVLAEREVVASGMQDFCTVFRV